MSSAPPTGKRSMTEHSFEREDKKDSGNEKDANGALQQCITELAASIGSGALKANEQRPQPAAAAGAAQGESSSSRQAASGEATGIHVDAQKEQQQQQSKPLRKSTSHFVTVIEVKEAKDKDHDDAGQALAVNDHQPTPPSTFGRYPERSKAAGTEATAPPLSPSMTSPAMSASSYAAHLEAKKKMPPR